ncbi:GNAT family N-acetyltransferase [Clostridium bovifaecis]|uniref:GNAT family N-acetyltransferase n=1 Tax=Clostridium bovifaecis TaxID=2184719 RepID=A0A6I6F1Q0_9CLOT|nr:GNAT family N-acetyltransferase [Clostridium bovifaecis]
MYKFYTLNKSNINEFKSLNDFRTEFNKLNKDFFHVYHNSNQFQQLLLKKRLRLLAEDSRYIGYLWTEIKGNSICLINSMYITKDTDVFKGYGLLLNSMKPYSIITYNCEKNEMNYDLLIRLGFNKVKALLEMKVNLDSMFQLQILDRINFHKVVRGKDEKLRCIIQNSIFCSEDRIPLKVEDIYYDEMQDYYCEDGAMLMKVNNTYIGYGQIIIKDNTPYIVNFGILKDYRSKGYGKMLLTYMLNILYKKGKKSIKIKVDSKNESAIKLYKSVGFIEETEQSQWQLNKII